MDFRLTSAGSRLAAVFLRDTAVGHYGHGLARELTTSESNVYTLLRLWAAAGIVTSTYEASLGAPRRVFHLTSEGEERLREAIFGEIES